MTDARHYSAHKTLSNGMEVLLRSLRPDDEERISEAFGKLEEDSIRSRYFGTKRGLTDAERRLIHELDFDRQVVLLATVQEDGREIVIASGSYSRTGPDAAEVAFIVEEDYQGQGIARCLLQDLALIAGQRGIVRFEADVLPSNQAMRRVFATIGWPMKSHPVDDVIHITLDLAPPAPGMVTSHA
jgi:RimJ/RimL family protein N-acetyltransferase